MNIVQGDRAGLSLVLPVHQWTQATSIAVATPLLHVQLTQLHRLSLLLPDCCGRDATSHTTSRHVITTCTHGFVLAVSRVMTCTAVCLSAVLTTKNLNPTAFVDPRYTSACLSDHCRYKVMLLFVFRHCCLGGHDDLFLSACAAHPGARHIPSSEVDALATTVVIPAGLPFDRCLAVSYFSAPLPCPHR